MAELKTKLTEQSVDDFIAAIPDEKRRADIAALAALLREVSGAEPRMWGESIIGFGDYHYKYASGREGDWFQVGLSPRKANLTVYLAGGYLEHDPLLKQLGKCKTGKGCLYINKLEEINLDVLRQMAANAIQRHTSS